MRSKKQSHVALPQSIAGRYFPSRVLGAGLAAFFLACANADAQTALDNANPAATGEPATLTIKTVAGLREPNTTGVVHTPAGSCFAVNTIRIEGQHDLIDSERLEQVVKPLAFPCQSNESVGGLLKALNGLFADKGLITTQVWLPEQDIAASKTLVLRVVPGRIDKVLYKEERVPYRWFLPRMAALNRGVAKASSAAEFTKRTGEWFEGVDDDLEAFTLLPPSARIAFARTIAKDDVLHVDRLQDTLDSLNRVPSHKAKADLAPGKRPATSDVVITNRINDAFRLYGGFDTESVEGVDRLRFGITAEKDNLIGINDSWGLTLKSGVETNELSGNVSVPVGRLTMRAKGDWSESTVDLGPLSELFIATWNLSAGADWIVHASRTERLVADLTITHREQNRHINGIGLADQRVSQLLAGLTYSRFFEHGSLTGRFGTSTGLAIFNARSDPDDIGTFTPHSQFSKVEASLSGSHVFPGKASLSSSLSAQWSADALYSDDQLTIGSRGSVRGFSNGSFKADRGAVWRNEVAFAMPADVLLGSAAAAGEPQNAQNSESTAMPTAEWARTVLSRLNPYVFIDAGAGRDIANEASGYRVSSGIGLRYGGPRLSFDAGYALRLAADAQSMRGSDENGEMFVTLRLKVF